MSQLLHISKHRTSTNLTSPISLTQRSHDQGRQRERYGVSKAVRDIGIQTYHNFSKARLGIHRLLVRYYIVLQTGATILA